jgi:putative transposase
VKFGFIAKHRGVWPADWLCEALGVSRGGFYAWLTRPRSQRSRSDEELGAKVRSSFLASDRTYGARRIWHDMLAEGVSCGLHRIERLMRLQALKARPRRRRLPPDLGERQAAAVAPNVLDRSSKRPLPIANGLLTSRMSGRRKAGFMWLPSSISSPGVWSAGR